MDDAERRLLLSRIALLEAALATQKAISLSLAEKFTDVAEKLKRCLESRPPCWRAKQHLGECRDGLTGEWAGK